MTTQLVDITTLCVDAIVNAANPTLLGGGGVDRAIHMMAGPGLYAECSRLPEVSEGIRCPTGEARITGGYMLRARHVIHTVGPIFDAMEPPEADLLLATAYRNSMLLAVSRSLTSIAFPCISTGGYGFPNGRAAQIAVSTVAHCLRGAPGIRRVIFACNSTRDIVAYRQHLQAFSTQPMPRTMSIPGVDFSGEGP